MVVVKAVVVEEEEEEEEEQVVLYYCYENIKDLEGAVERQTEVASSLGLFGRVRIASEGLNGTLSGRKQALDLYCKETEKQLDRYDIDWKWSRLVSGRRPFDDLLVKHVKDLVGATGASGQYSRERTGNHLRPEDFHQLADASDTTAIIDVRNTYEYQVGHFKGAINPDTRKYSEFEEWFRKEGISLVKDKEKVLMYCTGGIRCERASILVREVLEEELCDQALPEIHQLAGGIHRYLEHFGPAESKFLGRNFVFDKRVLQPQPHPEHEESVVVVGRCVYCDKEWERFVDSHRCEKCRMLVLVCEQCCENPNGVFCNTHEFLDPRRTTVEKIAEARVQLEARYASFAEGRKFKRKRQIISGQIRELEEALNKLQTLTKEERAGEPANHDVY